MTAAITGGLSMVSGLVGMIGGLRSSKQMQVPPPLDIGPGISPQMDILAGQEQQAAYQSQADELSREAIFSYQQAQLDAAQKAREGQAFKEEQALRFASSGITLQGSPLGVLEETSQLNQQEVNAIKQRGDEQSRLFEMEGLRMLRQGSASAFQGWASALQTNYQFKVQNIANQYDYYNRQQQVRAQQAQTRTQAYQSGLAGLGAGIQGFGALFGRGGGGGGSLFSSNGGYPSPFMVP